MDVFLNTITWDVFSFERLVLICCWQSKGTRTYSTKQDDFVGFRNITSLTSGRWLQKSGKHVGPNLTLKPNTKVSSLQFCKTDIKKILVLRKKEIATDIWPTCQQKRPPHLHKTGQVEGGWKIHSRGSFIHVSVILYISMYIYMSVFTTSFGSC